jgi:hypothetical protein
MAHEFVLITHINVAVGGIAPNLPLGFHVI